MRKRGSFRWRNVFVMRYLHTKCKLLVSVCDAQRAVGKACPAQSGVSDLRIKQRKVKESKSETPMISGQALPSVAAKACKHANKLQYPTYCFYIALSNTSRWLVPSKNSEQVALLFRFRRLYAPNRIVIRSVSFNYKINEWKTLMNI